MSWDALVMFVCYDCFIVVELLLYEPAKCCSCCGSINFALRQGDPEHFKRSV